MLGPGTTGSLIQNGQVGPEGETVATREGTLEGGEHGDCSHPRACVILWPPVVVGGGQGGCLGVSGCKWHTRARGTSVPLMRHRCLGGCPGGLRKKDTQVVWDVRVCRGEAAEVCTHARHGTTGPVGLGAPWPAGRVKWMPLSSRGGVASGFCELKHGGLPSSFPRTSHTPHGVVWRPPPYPLAQRAVATKRCCTKGENASWALDFSPAWRTAAAPFLVHAHAPLSLFSSHTPGLDLWSR